jgi:high-affinity iron transporter
MITILIIVKDNIMLEALIIALREGIEAFLIVAITLAYLRKTGRNALAPAVYFGTGMALLLSAAAAILLREIVITPLYEGILAFVAAILVASMLIYMMRAARHLSTEIGLRMEAAVQKPGITAFIAVTGFTLLMITREGMETAFMIASLMSQTDTSSMTVGALLGLMAAAALAWGWSRFGHRVNLRRFFQVTTIFLGMFSVQLIIYAFHEFTEAGVLPIDNTYWHITTEPYGPEGKYGLWLSYALVLVPLTWLLYSLARDRAARWRQLSKPA